MPPQPPPLDPPTILMPQPPATAEGGGARADSGLPPGMPATLAFSGEQSLFEQRLTAVLAGTAEGLQYDLADLYLLDDHTAELRCAASTGAARPPARQIEGAAGDLIAMAGEAVVLENFELMQEVGAPRECGAAVCVPVSSDRTIHGSLWVYCQQPRSISDTEIQLIEIVAGRLAVEVERRELLQGPAARPQSPTALAPGLPTPSVELDYEELEVAGRADEAFSLYDWHALGDGRVLTYAASFVETPGLTEDDAALTLRAARIALRCHAEGACDAAQMLNNVARVLSESEGGATGVSVAAAIIDPDSGVGSYALAGAAAAIRVRASAQSVNVTEDPPLGWDAAQKHPLAGFELRIRERLILAVGSPRDLTAKAARGLAKRFGTVAADAHRRMTATSALDQLYQATGRNGPRLDAAVALRRR